MGLCYQDLSFVNKEKEMAEEKKVFAGSGKIVTSWKRGISICLDDIQNYATKSKNGKFYVNLNIIDLKEPNQWGKDVEVVVNQWKPNQSKPNTPENFIDDSGDLQIPF
jgi:hypothetical protein